MDVAMRMMRLFEGCLTAHGVFNPSGYEGKKQIGKCVTVREEITEAKWEQHLAGATGLGVVPIDENNRCNWAAVDIDVYNLNYVDFLEKLKDYSFVVCQSKSGGVHMYIFFQEPTSAHDIREYLRNEISVMGLGNSEIFPKQDEVISKRGDVGNWINMPYFGNKRKCIVLENHKIKELEIEEFITYAESRKINLSEVKEVKINYEASIIKDGPPCLQALSLTGFPSGTRNISLFNLGVYAKKAHPTEWTRVIEKYNKELYKESLISREVATIIKSLDKKEYFYQCNEEPLCSFCNAKLCRTRKFGISATSAMPIINSVTKVAGDYSIWFIDVEGGRLELTTEELYDNRKFLLKCINTLNILPNKMKNEAWAGYLQGILDKAIIITDDQMFKRHEIPENFNQFVITRITKDHDEINQGRVVYIPERKEIQFKMETFLNYMKYKKIEIDRGWIVMYFRMRGAKYGVGKTKDRKSYRYTCLMLNDEEVVDIDTKLRMESVI